MKLFLSKIRWILFLSLVWAMPSVAASGVPLQKNPVFWLFVCFVVFIFIIIRYALKPFLATLDQKGQEVSQRLQEAHTLREKAIELHAEAKRTKEEAILEAQKIIEYAHKDAETIVAQGKSDLQQHMEKRKQLVENRIKLAENRAINDLKNTASDLATVMASGVIEQHFTDEDDRDLIDQTIAELPALLQATKNQA